MKEPKIIVLHWTGGCKKEHCYNIFKPAKFRRTHKNGKVNVGTQFIGDRDGTFYQLTDDLQICRHAVGVNHLSIGVENVGSKPDSKCPLNQKQVASNIAFIRHMKEKYPSITHVLGHYEVFGFRGNPLYSEKDPKYHKDNKSDPGKEFMAKVREGIADLGLLGG